MRSALGIASCLLDPSVDPPEHIDPASSQDIQNCRIDEAMVWVLACFCCSKRWVKKPSNKPGKLDVLFISESSNTSLTAQRLVPSVLDKRSNTNRYRLDGRVRDKWKVPEDAARHLRRSDTNVRVF